MTNIKLMIVKCDCDMLKVNIQNMCIESHQSYCVHSDNRVTL